MKSGHGIMGFVMSGLVVLAVIYLYNRFSQDGISKLGIPVVKA